ncbi:unknown protein [Microcystis aeruginosa NIES-843]|uniref:Uncharacterized protein n=1 Tax=Microcystis aeruginosa (strain NIES-843 / IAM M-2473) TaxID=449447 RepID=B0JK96_MICAN|nr:unknown protein [Microcystis aeruginosa NIES-843]
MGCSNIRCASAKSRSCLMIFARFFCRSHSNFIFLFYRVVIPYIEKNPIIVENSIVRGVILIEIKRNLSPRSK